MELARVKIIKGDRGVTLVPFVQMHMHEILLIAAAIIANVYDRKGLH
jgi:hypothetical protein